MTDIQLAIWKTWQAIGDDVEALWEPRQSSLNAQMRAEIVLDANHLETNGCADPETLTAFYALSYDEQIRIAKEVL